MSPTLCFNAARGFVGGATSELVEDSPDWRKVSMPHAALWVVQPFKTLTVTSAGWGFNAARGFVGGAAPDRNPSWAPEVCFNAARGFVGGAA